jgi:ubiquinone/menaquinone biosynthesis C-methylase UbiE
MAKTHKKADQYNDPSHNYLKYWEGRDYENASEEAAISRLIKGRHFKHAVDVGGGYGRLCVLLENFADKVTLAEPSQQQLDIAKAFLKDHPEVERKLLQADDLKFTDSSVGLLTMIRVMHHLPDPMPEFSEIHRVLANDGVFILELANNAHARNRIKYGLKGKGIPAEPVDIRSPQNQREEEIPFVNHNPKTVIKQLEKAGFEVEKVLSVSNLRSTTVKKIVPKNVMLSVEKLLQPTLAKISFGPSIFLLLRKAK